MKLSRPLSVLVIASITVALQQFKYCDCFAAQPVGGEYQQGFNITILESASVLVIAEIDAAVTNAPIEFGNDYDLFGKTLKNGFGICTENMAKRRECLEEGTFSLKFARQIKACEPILNKVYKAGEDFFYAVEASGRYCVYGYHDSNELGIKHSSYKPYGSLNPSDDAKRNILSKMVVPLEVITTLLIITKHYISKKRANKPIVSSQDKAGVIQLGLLAFCYHAQILNTLTMAYDTGFSGFNASNRQMTSLWIAQIIDIGIYQLILLILFRLSQGAHGILYDEFPKTNGSFTIMNTVVFLCKSVSSTNVIGKIPIVPFLIDLVSDRGDFILGVMIWRTSRTTGMRITDIRTQRNFNNSVNLVLFLPAFLGIISHFSNFILSCKVAKTLDVSELTAMEYLYTYASITKTTEKIYTSSIIWAILQHSPLLALPLMIICLAIIWTRENNEKYQPPKDIE